MDIIAKIKNTAIESPERLVFSSRDGEMTYGELWNKSSALASYISNRLDGNREPIMVYGHKHPDMLVAFLACVRSGHAYCPVDIGNPPERVSDIASAIDNEIVIVTQHEDMLDIDSKYEVVGRAQLESIFDGDTSFEDREPVSGDETYYIIFTSGSTGKPKGVKIPADALNNYLKWSVTLSGGISEATRFLNQAPFSFDLSVMDIYTGLATGSTIIALDKGLQQDMSEMLKYISASNIEYWVSTPSFSDMCLGEAEFSEEKFGSIKAFLFCGEVLAKDTAKQLRTRFPRAKVINTYGPTESTVCVTEIDITDDVIAKDGALPIGLPKPGTEIRIDSENSEMIIVGDSVSSGYYNDKERTDKVFFMAEAGSLSEDPKELIRAYRTGDTGHYDESGMLFCDGRIDHQIKLHGYRIELGDIESNLTNIEGVAAAAVIPKKREGKVESLTAFVVREGDIIADDYSGRKYVREALKDFLPSYMVPKRVKFIDKMPLTNNGKADRKKLEELV
ncbi:D-alanine--poly(phosphoribitol) ligase subunit DltA [Mogibacterium pumilum]|uniref:D-alanine--poly(Phosphoribitol) ligase n=1 Tax=Mogibacterium pumilum TaxID=86332 RepID=A0A223ATA1_9FIRM|nr:D-alanine--poly(phosphoribitol) ligase subunit DltA [Mogibacterium pumilum]ASS38207.1 hypothetical protein AXF17_07195 [Mogibacterium pumilum]